MPVFCRFGAVGNCLHDRFLELLGVDDVWLLALSMQSTEQRLMVRRRQEDNLQVTVNNALVSHHTCLDSQPLPERAVDRDLTSLAYPATHSCFSPLFPKLLHFTAILRNYGSNENCCA
jgi:hypothetical protein